MFPSSLQRYFSFSRKATGAPSGGEFMQWCPVARAKGVYDDDGDDRIVRVKSGSPTVINVSWVYNTLKTG